MSKLQSNILKYAAQDKYFDSIIDQICDYGFMIRFPFFERHGVYQPFALSTEKLDTPEKAQQFSNGFLAMAEQGAFRAEIRLPRFSPSSVKFHLFLHEVMHFYQDMLGLYFIPLKEQGKAPVMPDVHSFVRLFLFCEAWAEIEAIRTSWALREKGDARGWDGALKSADWKDLAVFYDSRLNEGESEAKVAADTFRKWYSGYHRDVYEMQALKIYQHNCERFLSDVENTENVSEFLRIVDIPNVIETFIPKDMMPRYFSQIDWHHDVFEKCKNPIAMSECLTIEQRMGRASNDVLTDIKCGSPPYIWKRLRHLEISQSQHPPAPAPEQQNG